MTEMDRYVEELRAALAASSASRAAIVGLHATTLEHVGELQARVEQAEAQLAAVTQVLRTCGKKIEHMGHHFTVGSLYGYQEQLVAEIDAALAVQPAPPPAQEMPE
jgi:hypothetical protein